MHNSSISTEDTETHELNRKPVGDRFWRNHLLIPLICFLALAVLFENTRIDLMLADWIYGLEGGRWTLKHNYLFSTILHDDAKSMVKAMLNIIIVLAIASNWIGWLKPYRRALWYLALAIFVSTLLVNVGKRITHVDCPWSLTRYGGGKPYIRLLEPSVEKLGYGKCFPAGHASAGYALLAFYFFLLYIRPTWRYYGLGIGIAVGMVFGITQQLRGAHFLSHDLWTISVCWFISLAWYKLLLKDRVMPRKIQVSD